VVVYEVMRTWARKRAKEGIATGWEKPPPSKDSRASLPKRWVVERTFSWMSKDYERLPESGEAFIYVAMSRLMVRRLARS
jgi:putative transposase